MPGTYNGDGIRGCAVGAWDGTLPTTSDFIDAEQAKCAYIISSSVYGYAESLGIDVYGLADTALAHGTNLSTAALSIGDKPIDEGAWADWVRTTFG